MTREEIIVNNAAGITNLTEKNNRIFSDFQLIGIVLVIIVLGYIAYSYVKNKFSRKVAQEVTRQTVA